MRTNKNIWSAFHVFLSGSLELEQFINSWLGPKAKELITLGFAEKWFFMRYWDGGPHIRVRFLNLKDETSVFSEIQKAAKNYLTKNPISAEQYYSEHKFDGEPVDVEKLHWHEDGTVVMYDYEPEIQRYGGEFGIYVNEALFNTSSDLAIAIIKQTEGNIDKRLQVSLVLIIASIFSFKPSVAILSSFCNYYAEFWSSHVTQPRKTNNNAVASQKMFQSILKLQQEVEDGVSKGAQAIWVANLKKGIKQFENLYKKKQLFSPFSGKKIVSKDEYDTSVLSMLGSQIHMLNNRLGDTPPYEYYLTTMILDAINYSG